MYTLYTWYIDRIFRLNKVIYWKEFYEFPVLWQLFRLLSIPKLLMDGTEILQEWVHRALTLPYFFGRASYI